MRTNKLYKVRRMLKLATLAITGGQVTTKCNQTRNAHGLIALEQVMHLCSRRPDARDMRRNILKDRL